MQLAIPSTRLAAGIVAGLAAAVLGLGTAATAPAAIKLGVYSAAPGKPTAMEDRKVMDQFIAMVGGTPAILHDFRNVTDPLLTPSEVAILRDHGMTPMITWQMYKSGWSGSVITLPDIVAGHYDSQLRQAAQRARDLPFEVMIRFAHEMNGDWYPWSPGREAGNVGTNYVDAWRHMVSIFRQEGATNVKWVWCPNVDYGNYPFAQFFPGDAWVDYVALDGYNWGTVGTGGMQKWQSLAEVFGPSYEKLTQMSNRPVVIAETSSSEHGGAKADWIRQGFLSTIPKQFPRVAAAVWFDRDMERDWRVNSSDASLQAFRDVMSSSIYGGPDPAPDLSNPVEAPVSIKKLRTPRKVKATAAGQSTSKVGGKVLYTLSKRARRVKLRVLRLSDGRGPRVFAAVPVSGKKPSSASAGTSSVGSAAVRGQSRRGGMRLSKLLAGRTLRPGVYRVVAVAIGADGRPSKPRRSTFRVVSRN